VGEKGRSERLGKNARAIVRTVTLIKCNGKPKEGLHRTGQELTDGPQASLWLPCENKRQVGKKESWSPHWQVTEAVQAISG
jgi:hypothetical protein